MGSKKEVRVMSPEERTFNEIMGRSGFFRATTGTYTGAFIYINCMEDADLDIQGRGISETGYTLTAGQFCLGDISSVTVNSGAVDIYYSINHSDE